MTVDIPTVFHPWSRVQWIHRSDSELESLMGTMPFMDPDAPWTEIQVLREALVDCLDLLGAEDRFMVEAIWFERVTIRELASRLGLEKSHTHRLCTRAVVRLGERCVEHPVLQARYGLHPGLQSAS